MTGSISEIRQCGEIVESRVCEVTYVQIRSNGEYKRRQRRLVDSLDTIYGSAYSARFGTQRTPQPRMEIPDVLDGQDAAAV